jgi:hypothetical protein
MQRILLLLLSLFMTVALGACAGSEETSGHATGSSVTAETEPPATTVLTAPTTTSPTTVPVPAVAATPTTPGPTSDAGAAHGQCPDQSSLAVSAVPDTTLDKLFESYGDRGRGATWTGGDGTESVSLGHGRELWFFADSYLGKVMNGQLIRGGGLLHNTMVVERNGVLTKTLYKGRRNAATAFLDPVPQNPSGYGFWPGSMVVNGKTLDVIGLDVTFAVNGTYSVTGNSLATFTLPSLRLVALQALPVSQTDWSGGTLRDGGYTYIYGSSQPNTFAARVAGTNLAVPWSYYDGNGWTSDPAAAVPIENVGTLSHFSVSKVRGVYVFITKSSFKTNEITAAFGCSPVGPFGSPEPIYATPEGSEYPSSYAVSTYGAFAHPELSTSPNTLVVSYDVGAQGPVSTSVIDASIYRPRFLDVTVP